MKNAIDYKKLPVTSLIPGAPEKEKEFNAKEAWEACLIDPKEEVAPPETVLGIRDGITGEMPACTLGNFSVVTGKAKSRKTFLVTILLAALLSGREIFDLIRGKLPEGKQGILYLDTEQGKYHATKAMRRALDLAGIKEDPLLKFGKVRSHSTDERKQIFEYAIANVPHLGFVIIDGIRDLVDSINEETENKKMVDWIMKLSEIYNCHILVVIHQNKSNEHVRGTLGTELVNKAETVFSVTKVEEDDLSIVRSPEARERNFKPFAIGYDEETKLPTVIQDYKIQPGASKPQKGKQKTTKYCTDFDDKIHMNKMNSFFLDLKRNMGTEKTTSRDIQERVEYYYGPGFNVAESKRLPLFLKGRGILESNEATEPDNAKRLYWLSEKTKKEGEPIPF